MPVLGPNIALGAHARGKGGGAFDPSMLYQPGDVLLWYDPSDLSTMFQDVLGTTPVTADGQSVALHLDKGGLNDGRGVVNLLLRSDNLTASPWANAGTTLASDGAPDDALMVASGVGITVGAVGYFTAGAAAYRSQPVASLPAGTYTYSMRVKANGYNAIQLRAGTSATMNPTISDGFGIFDLASGIVVSGTNAAIVSLGDGYYLVSMTFTLASTTTVHFGFWCWNSTSVTADGTKGYLISYAQVERGSSATAHQANGATVGGPGHHRTQATGTSMPKYKTGPNPAAAENSPELVTNGALTSNTTGWTVVNSPTITHGANGVTIQNAGATYGLIYQALATTIGRSYRIRATIDHTGTTNQARIDLFNSVIGAVFSTYLGVTADGTYEFVFTATATTTYLNVGNQNGNNALNAFKDISVKEIPASAPYTHWLLYDGSDDSTQTPTITWGTDEVAICAGLTKSSDAASGVFAEFSASTDSNTGSFLLLAPSSVGANSYRFVTRGSTGIQSAGTGVFAAAPDTAVISGSAKIATDLVKLRRNAADVANPTLDQGTGNYGSYPMYFGRRGGATAPFNGREYQTVIRSRLLSASELSRLETFVAAKTGVIL